MFGAPYLGNGSNKSKHVEELINFLGSFQSRKDPMSDIGTLISSFMFQYFHLHNLSEILPIIFY